MADVRSVTGRRLATALFVLLVIAPLVTVAIASTFLFRPGGRYLEIEMRADSGDVAQIFWSADYAFSGDRSHTELLHQHPGSFDRLRFPLPDWPIELVRFDPINGSGEILIKSMRVLNARGETVRTVDPVVLAPLYQIARVMPSADGVRIVTTPGANDPMLLLKGSWLVGTRWHGLQFVTPFSLAWIAAAAAILIATALAYVLRDLLAGPFGLRHALWFALLFVAVLWARAALLQHYPVPVPFWDQWDGEGATLYIPWWHDGLSWRQMFMLHNEHRIFFSRVLAVSLLVLNGQWDPHLQILVNAVVQSLAALVFAAAIWISLGRRHLPIVITVVALVFAPPFALENSLNGFQSAFYFLLLFSALALWLMTWHRPGTRAWLVGLFCAFCCPFTVAGGTFIIAAIGAIAVLQVIAEPKAWRRAAVTIAALVAIAGVAYAGLSPPIPYHEQLKAASAQAFAAAFARNLAFPWINVPWASILVWLPLLASIAVVLTRRLRTTAGERLWFGLAVWVLLQAAAIAYSRGVTGVAPTSRYLDLLSFGFVLNTMVLLTWLTQPTRRRTIAVAAALTVWTIAGAAGIARLSKEMVDTAARQRELWSREHVRTVRNFVVSHNMDELLEKRGPQELPYHSAWMLANWLDHPYMRRILPAIVRAPLVLQAQSTSSGGFVETRSASEGVTVPVFDSYTGNRAKSEGRFESQPIACTDFHHVRFDVAGAANDNGLELALKDQKTGTMYSVHPAPGTRSGWTGASARCPDGPFTVVAVDDSARSWLAFRYPSEIAMGSAVAESLIEETPALGVFAAALALLTLGWEFAAARARWTEVRVPQDSVASRS